MSWARNRQTTRTEDIAYCLLGIFDVHMPLLYGEGEKAFVRLQEEIMKHSDDQTLFAWVPDSARHSKHKEITDWQELGRNPRWEEYGTHGYRPPQIRGIFAQHPSEFSLPQVSRSPTLHYGGMTNQDRVASATPYALTNKGVEITLRLLNFGPTLAVAVLDCIDNTDKENVGLGIVLEGYSHAPNFYRAYRAEPYGLVRLRSRDLHGSSFCKVYLIRKT